MITFINPWAFLWFFPVAVVLLVFYARRARRLIHETSAGSVWKDSISILDPRYWWRPWRRLTSFLIQLGIALAFVFCMAEPCLRPPQRMAVVIDCTQSMADALNSQSEVRLKLADMVKNLGYHDRIALIAAGNPPRILCRTTSERDKILTALDQFLQKPELTSSPEALTNALDVAKALVVRKVGAQPDPKTENIVLISDGCFPEAGQAFLDPAVHWLPVGKTRESAPITRLGARWISGVQSSKANATAKEQEQEIAVLAEISNFSEKTNSGTLTIGSVKQEITLKPDEIRIVRIVTGESDCQVADSESNSTAADSVQTLQRTISVVWKAEINGTAFETELPVPKQNQFPVFLITRKNSWLAQKISDIPVVSSVVTATDVPANLPEQAVLIFDGVTPQTAPTTRCLFFGPENALPPLWGVDSETAVSDRVAAVNRDFAHGFWNGVNLTGQLFVNGGSMDIADEVVITNETETADNPEKARDSEKTEDAEKIKGPEKIRASEKVENLEKTAGTVYDSGNSTGAYQATVLASNAQESPLGWSISGTIPNQFFVFCCDLSISDWPSTPGFSALLTNIFRVWSDGNMDPSESRVYADLDGRVPQLDQAAFALPGEDVVPLWTIIGVLLLAAVCVEWVLYQRRWLE